jgi:hypothetical protein
LFRYYDYALTVAEMQTLYSTDGKTLAQLKASGYTATQLKALGYTASDLRGVGYTAVEVKAGVNFF